MIITHDSLWTDRLLSSFSVKYFISFLYVELPRILLLSENYSPVIASATTDKKIKGILKQIIPWWLL